MSDTELPDVPLRGSSASMSLEELWERCRRLLDSPHGGTLADIFARLLSLGTVAFEAVCQSRFDGQPEAAFVALEAIEEFNRTLETMRAGQSESQLLAENPIERDVESVHSTPRSKDPAIEALNLQRIAMTIEMSMTKCALAAASPVDLLKFGVMMGILGRRLGDYTALLASRAPHGEAPARDSVDEIARTLGVAPGQHGRLSDLLRSIKTSVDKSHTEGRLDQLPNISLALDSVEGRLQRMEECLRQFLNAPKIVPHPGTGPQPSVH